MVVTTTKVKNFEFATLLVATTVLRIVALHLVVVKARHPGILSQDVLLLLGSGIEPTKGLDTLATGERTIEELCAIDIDKIE